MPPRWSSTFWMRLSIETYPGIRRSAVILPSALTGHGLVLLFFAMTRLPYDRLALTARLPDPCRGALRHLRLRRARADPARSRWCRSARPPDLGQIDNVDWLRMKRPVLADARSTDAIVADFSADLPDEWEAFLADAALDGRIVYQVKQLSESLTGRVELEHLSENSFGSLLPARGYFHLKAMVDFLFAHHAAADRTSADGWRSRSPSASKARGPVLFRQNRVGHAGQFDHRLQIPHHAGR